MNMPTPASSPALDAATLLGQSAPRRWWQRGGMWLLFALIAAAGGIWYWQQRGQAGQVLPQYVTQAVQRGDLTLSVMANGTLQPTRSISIGSELSGMVSEVFVDVNDRVKKGQVLVALDTSKLRAQLERSRAALASAQARLAEAQATQAEAHASLQRLLEVQRLSGGKVPSAAELDSAKAALERAQASHKAMLASVQDNRAAVATHETDLSKASIVSPIDGVVLTRAVEPGYAVAASLQAVTLFTLAEDLRQLRLDVNVDEADVGRIGEGQRASFTVSAWPGRHYPAQVARVAYGSTITDNVVTYTTRLNVDNQDLSLRPGMTASATIVATERRDVLLVPNAALRFAPAAAGGAGLGSAQVTNKSAGASLMSQLNPRMGKGGPGGGAGQRRARNDGQDGVPDGMRQVWIEQNGQAVPVSVRVGVSNGRVTEVSGGQLQAGMQVIVDQKSAPPR